MKKFTIFILITLLSFPLAVYAQNTIEIDISTIMNNITMETKDVEVFHFDEFNRIDYTSDEHGITHIFTFYISDKPSAILVKGSTNNSRVSKTLLRTGEEIDQLIQSDDVVVTTHISEELNEKYYSFIADDSITFDVLYVAANSIIDHIEQSEKGKIDEVTTLFRSNEFEALNSWIRDNKEEYPASVEYTRALSILDIIETFWDNLVFNYDSIEDRTIVSYKNLTEINEMTNVFSEIEINHNKKHVNFSTNYGLINSDWIFFEEIVLKFDDIEPYHVDVKGYLRDDEVLDNNTLFESYSAVNINNPFYHKELSSDLIEMPSYGTIRFKGQSDIDIELSKNEIEGMFVLAKYAEYLTWVNRLAY